MGTVSRRERLTSTRNSSRREEETKESIFMKLCLVFIRKNSLGKSNIDGYSMMVVNIALLNRDTTLMLVIKLDVDSTQNKALMAIDPVT